MSDIPPVQVCIRVRPPLDSESADGHVSLLEFESGKSSIVTLLPRESVETQREQVPADHSCTTSSSSRSMTPRTFQFNTVCGPETSQQHVWDQSRLSEVVGKIVDGFHATVFAYGQTGSGKTHTMEGLTSNNCNGSTLSTDARRSRVCELSRESEHIGIVPRAVHELFRRVDDLRGQAAASAQDDVMFSVKVSFLQIYKERIYDLLNSESLKAGRRGEDGPGLRLRWDAAKASFFVENLFEYECASVEDVMQQYASGTLSKQVASTAMNIASSRSHTIFTMTLTQRTLLAQGGSSRHDDAPFRQVVSSLTLVDLAGSERASGVDRFKEVVGACLGGTNESAADRFKEAVNINQSLFALRRVVTALSQQIDGVEEHMHVPYRDSKLTSLLQHALGGNSYTLMLACLSPLDKYYDENLSTLQYAAQAARIKNQPRINVDLKDHLIHELQQQLHAAHDYILSQMGFDELPPELKAKPLSAASVSTTVRRGRQRPRACGDSLSCKRHDADLAPFSSGDLFASDSSVEGQRARGPAGTSASSMAMCRSISGPQEPVPNLLKQQLPLPQLPQPVMFDMSAASFGRDGLNQRRRPPLIPPSPGQKRSPPSTNRRLREALPPMNQNTERPLKLSAHCQDLSSSWGSLMRHRGRRRPASLSSALHATRERTSRRSSARGASCEASPAHPPSGGLSNLGRTIVDASGLTLNPTASLNRPPPPTPPIETPPIETQHVASSTGTRDVLLEVQLIGNEFPGITQEHEWATLNQTSQERTLPLLAPAGPEEGCPQVAQLYPGNCSEQSMYVWQLGTFPLLAQQALSAELSWGNPGQVAQAILD